jgi:hypothetical protein
VKTFTVEELVAASVDWFRLLGSWPEESVEETIRIFNRARTDTAGHYGVQAILLMFAAANKGQWPPMPPKKFAAALKKDPLPVGKYARWVMMYEAQNA